MKIKIFTKKRNGQLAKNPFYTSELDKESCAFKILNVDAEAWMCEYNQKSLYEIYREILKLKDFNFEFYIGKDKVSNKKFIDKLKEKILIFENQINTTLEKHKSRITELEEMHKNSFSSLTYVATEMGKSIEEYKELIQKIKILQSGRLKYCVDERWGSYEYVMEDIDSIKAEAFVDFK